MNTAQRIIEKLGGALAVAEIVGIDVSNVHRWTYPRNRGGGDGTIPSRHLKTLLAAARERNVLLTPADFFDEEEAA